MARGDNSSQPYSFNFLPAPPALADLCNSFYFFDTPLTRLADVLPAYSGQLMLILKGKCSIITPSGDVQGNDDCTLLAPLLQAHEFILDGPVRVFGVSLNFRGWATLTGLPVDQYNNGQVELETAFGEEVAAKIRDLARRVRDGEMDEQALPEAVTEVLAVCQKPLRRGHRMLIDETLEWLSSSFRPELDDLYARLPMSRRQAQRNVARFFGVPPVHLARRYRAVRAATILSLPEIPPALEAEIREAFYDQPHMIKEIRYFTGRTPHRLRTAEGGPVPDTLHADGYSAVDPFGGSEASQLGKQP
ncbi:helix-turn-helix domain-containing protein [Aurantiacibacter sp. MUD11]|uniref:helix-turn-helix domain-containing protein n=1 Tax=Aurantiacibacter sp. MUD11 TaxID=3003265 RepID=UPI0022AA5DFD|nr:helix-turn-helix domain-containing protein [Aurantiacibacter sp. MUD11]WAT17152.1 helix-turn-helix domain-containing protein [Aurantiacibacter sp. MUD11]